MLRIGGLFAGVGGLEQGVQQVLDAHPVWFSEVDAGACRVLSHRFPDVPNLGDITNLDWKTVPRVDILTGGFPCQDVSTAGFRKGLRPGTRTGLWSHFVNAINELRPQLVIAENVRGLLSADAASSLEPCAFCVGDDTDHVLRALGAVLGDLADIGYDAQWQGLRASDVGAPHGRFRVFIAARAADPAGGERWSAGVGGPEGAGRAGSPNGDSGTLNGDRRNGFAAVAVRRRLDTTRASLPTQVALYADGDRQPGWPSGTLAVTLPRVDRSGSGAVPDSEGAEWRTPQQHDLGTTTGSAAEFGERVSGTPNAWGRYGPAIRRWEHITNRLAPTPTITGTDGRQRLAGAFTEWLMGYPAGWVTDTPGVTNNDALRMCGNGVVPQQAAAALRILLRGTQ